MTNVAFEAQDAEFLKNHPGVQVVKTYQLTCSATMTILMGGMSSDNPTAFMNGVVSDYVGSKMFNVYEDVHKDNPYTRIVIIGNII